MGTIMLTGLDEVTLDRLKLCAAGEELAPAAYVTRLVELHATLRRIRGTRDEAAELATKLLRAAGLGEGGVTDRRSRTASPPGAGSAAADHPV